MKTLYQISFIGRNGLRTLMGPAQGRHMHPTRDAAEEFLGSLMTNTGVARLLDIYGEQSRGTFRVDAFQCYDNGDPMGIYVDAPDESLV